MAELWFTADTHYGHTSVIRFCNRPWANIHEHDEALIQRHNALVKPEDTVIIVGDFAWENHARYIMKLNGKKTLIIGSHDGMPQEALRCFTRVIGAKNQPGILEFNVGPHRVVACHYPMMSWGASFHGSWHIRGHSHGRLPERPDVFSVDVGVDVWNYRPVNFDVMRRIMLDRKEAWRARCEANQARDDEQPNGVEGLSASHMRYLHAWQEDWDKGVYKDTDYATRYKYHPSNTTQPVT